MTTVYGSADKANVKQITSPRNLSGVLTEQAIGPGHYPRHPTLRTRQAMRPERPQTWRSEEGSRIWLSGLIAAMEHAGRPDIRRQPVAPETLAELRAQLALPASFRLPQLSTLRH
jgi:hypothetical protein